MLATATSHNQTAKVTKADVLGLLSRYPLPPPDEREIAYNRAVEPLVNTQLLNQFLTSQHVEVPEVRIDEQVDAPSSSSSGRARTCPRCCQSDKSMTDLRKEIADQLRFSEFAKTKATEAELRKFLNDNRDRFRRTQVRASHILLKVEPTPAAEKEKIKQKLIGIRNDILQNQLTFAEAANKYSDDPANEEGAGGDLD